MNIRTSIFEISPSSSIRPIVLVIDDSSDTLNLLCEGLSSAGYITIPAKNKAEALKCLEFTSPDVILLDATSPGAGGFALGRQIKSIPGRSEIPLLFMIELANNDQIINSFENGGSDYISKPVCIPEVLARLLTRIISRLNTR